MATTDVQLRLVISAINRAGGELGRIGEQLKSASNRAKELGTSSAQAGTKGAQGIKKLGTALEELKPKFEAIKRASDQMVSAGMQIAQVGAGLLAAAVFPAVKAASFEKAMADVRAVTTGVVEDFAALESKAKDLGATTEWTAKQVAGALEFLGMAGMDARDALDAVEPALLLASAGGLELAQAADIATNIMKGLNLETSELTHVTDVLAYAASNANTSVGDLGLAFSYVAGFVRSAGMSIEMAASMLGGLADAGYRATRGGTALRGVILGLSKVTPMAQKAFDRLGVQISRNADGTIDFVKTLIDLNEAGADTADWATIFTRSFGAAASILALSASQLTANAEAMEDVSGKAKEMAEVRLDNLWGALKLLTSALDGLATAMGDPLLKPLADMAKGLAKAVSSMRDWATENSVAAGTITAVIGGLGGFLVALAAILIPLGLFGKLIGMVGSGLVVWPALLGKAGAAIVAFRALLLSTTKAALLLRPALLALGVIWAMKEVYDAAKAFIAWRQEAAKVEVALQDLYEQGTKLVEKFGEFKDIEPPKEEEGFIGKTKKQLKELNEELIKAHLYWRGIKIQLEERAKERTFWLFETEGAKAAKKQLAEVNVKLQEFRFARNEIFKAMKKAGGVLSADDFLSPEELADLRSDILETMGDVAKGISESISQSFAAVDTDPMIKKLEAAQLEISRNAELSGEERARLSEKIEIEIANARLAVIQTSLGEALAAWDKHESELMELSRVSFQQQVIDDEEYGARTIAIMEEIAEKKMQALAKVRKYLESDLSKSLAAERRYADAIEKIQDDIADFHKTAQDRIRELRRRGMSEEAAYTDEVRELNEKLAEARALDPSQYEKAKELFRDVMSTASSLVGEIKKGDRVLVSEQKTIETAIGLIEQAEKGLAVSGAKASAETAARLKDQKEVTQKLIQSLDAVAAKFDFLAQKLSLALELKLNVDTTQIDNTMAKMKGLEEEKSWCDQLFDEPTVIAVDTDAVDEATVSIKALREATEEPVSVELEDNAQDVEANIKGALERVRQAGESIPVDLSTVSSMEELDRLAQEVYKIQEETGKPLKFVGIDTANLEFAIRNIGLFKQALADVAAEPVIAKPVQVAAETVGEEKVDDLAEAISYVEDKEVEAEAEVIGLDAVRELAKEIADLKDKTVTITKKIVTVREGGAAGESFAQGGQARGGGEIPAILHSGEFVLCAEAVRAIGLNACHLINKRLLQARSLFSGKGAVQHFAAGGLAGGGLQDSFIAFFRRATELLERSMAQMPTAAERMPAARVPSVLRKAEERPTAEVAPEKYKFTVNIGGASLRGTAYKSVLEQFKNDLRRLSLAGGLT